MKYIVIEGNIGGGKTTLATKLATDFKAKFLPEQFDDNPFLPKFYKNPQRYSFQLELSFLVERYNQIKKKSLLQKNLVLFADINDIDFVSESENYDNLKKTIFNSDYKLGINRLVIRQKID